MKKKLISLFMSMLMVAAVFVPVSAENLVGSPTGDAKTHGTIEVNGETVYLVNSTDDENYKTQAAILVTTADGKSGSELTNAVVAKVKNESTDPYKSVVSGVSGLKSLLVLDVRPNETAKGKIGDTKVQITINYSGIESNATYYAVHVFSKNDSSTEATEYSKCSNGDGTLTFEMSGFSPVIIYKVVDSKTTETTDNNANNNNQSSGKAITCESEHGKGWVWSESKNACVYKVTNTSAK